MSEDINIGCFLWDDWCGSWGPYYVNALFHGILCNLEPDFVFTVGADKRNARKCHEICDERIIIKEIDSPSWEGCLPKLNAFNPDMGFQGRVLIFDLDSVIVGPVEPFVDAIDEGLTTRAWFRGIPKGIWKSGGDLLGFKAGWGKFIWELFTCYPDWIESTVSEGGRERYIYRKWLDGSEQISYWQDKVPDRYLSYKNHIKGRNKIPGSASIISCHGNPRPHEIQESCIKNSWMPKTGPDNNYN